MEMLIEVDAGVGVEELPDRHGTITREFDERRNDCLFILIGTFKHGVLGHRAEHQPKHEDIRRGVGLTRVAPTLIGGLGRQIKVQTLGQLSIGLIVLIAS